VIDHQTPVDGRGDLRLSQHSARSYFNHQIHRYSDYDTNSILHASQLPRRIDVEYINTLLFLVSTACFPHTLA
jgi:hypothetical protein